MHDVSRKELYRIFNNILNENSFLKYEEMDREISLFSKRARERWQNNPQIDIFEEPPATFQEIINVLNLCDTLKTYYTEINKDNYTEDSLSESFYRLMYIRLEKCSAYVSKENKEKYDIMKRNTQRCLPEFKNKIIIEDYIKEAEKIYKLRQKSQRIKEKEKREIQKNYCERFATVFFNEIKQDKTLREMEYCPEMLVLCEKVLQIVDCLPSDRFGRIKKYGMKKSINKSIENIAKSLGGAYEKVAKTAIIEQQKYENAIQKTKQYLENPPKYKKRELSPEEINKRARDEWLYK